MAKRVASKVFYILLVLAIVCAIALPFAERYTERFNAYAAGEGEAIQGESGVTYYRTYRIFEQAVNHDGKYVLTFREAAKQINNVLTEGAYKYANGSTSDDLFRRALVYWYNASPSEGEETLFGSPIRANISVEKDEELQGLLTSAWNAVKSSLSAEEVNALVSSFKTEIVLQAEALDNMGLKPFTFYKEAELDAAYYLSYNAYSKAAKKAGVEEITYTEVAKQIGNLLDEGLRRYAAGESDYYICFTNPYGSWYETSGFERKVMAYISGSRVTAVELQFAKVKQAAGSGKGTTVAVEVIAEEVSKLKEMLNVDAKKLDELLGLGTEKGKSGSLGWATFLGCFTILVREGLEAILIVGAMVAYLIKANEKRYVKFIYIGGAVALVASALLAWLLYSLSWTGVPQEIIEGVTALIAVAVLIYVSNWMISKAESDAWTKYISGKVSGSVGKGKVWALAFTSFLAVFREGAEVILFYQPLVSSAKDIQNGGWAIAGGILAGIAVVAIVFVLIRVFGIKIPLKPFFLATSILMAAMSIIFLGSGIWELFIDGGIWPVGIIAGIESWAENDVLNFFGIYPTWLTLIPQMVLFVITIVTFVLWIRKGKKDREKAKAAEIATENATEIATATENATETEKSTAEKAEEGAEENK